MAKKILPIFLLALLSFTARAQYAGGMDSTRFNGRKALVKMPSGPGPFGLMIEWGTTAENADANPSGLSGLYATGTAKRLNAGGNPYFLKGNGDSAKYIVVKIQRGAYSDDAFSDDMAFTLPAIFAYCGSKLDTIKYTDGTYKYIGMIGEERGADIIFNSITQNTAINNCFYHANPGWIFNHIRKLYVARINDVCQYGSYDPFSAYNHATNKKIWYYRKTGDGTIEPSMISNLTSFSIGVSQRLTSYSGFTNTQLSDSIYSIRGQYYFDNVYRDLLDDTTNKPPANYQAKVYTIFSLSTYSQHDPQPPQNFFDGNGVIDPKNGVTTDTTSIGNPQHKWDTSGGAPLKAFYAYSGNVNGTIWPGQRQIRLILDLGGVKDLRDTTKKFSITDIYGLSGEEAGHPMYFYNADVLFRQSIPNAIRMLSRPDSLMTPFATLTTTGYGAGWVSAATHDSMRYVMIVITTASAHPSQFNELTFYGHYVGDTTGRSALLAPSTYTGPLPSKKDTLHTFGKTMGTNLFQGLGPLSTSHDGDFRLYTSKWYYDTYAGRGIPPSYTPWTSTDVNTAWIQNLKARGKTVHFTNQSSNQYAAAQGSQIDIDSSGLDPELPWNYLRAGDFAYNWAALYGKNAISTSLTKWAGNPPNGLNLFDTYEAGNEVEGHGGSYMSIFMKLSMEWDGHCGLYGVSGRTGIKNADSTMLLSTPGMIDPDTSFVATAAFLTALTRPDGVVPFQIVAVHKYMTQKDIGKGIYYSLDDQIGIRGEAPEWYGGPQVGYLKYWDRVARNMYKWIPLTTRIDHTEQGYGNCNQMISSTFEAASIYDVYPLIAFGGHTVHVSKAIILDRVRILEMFTPVSKYNNYASSNQYGDTTNSVRFLFYAYGIAAAIGGYPYEFTVFYAGWYHQAGFYHQLKNYYPDSVLINGGRTSPWLVRVRNAYKPDSVAYIPWLPTYTGATLGGQSINFGALASQSVVKWTPSDTDTTGSFTSLAATAGILSSQTLSEVPVVYFAKEVLTSAAKARVIRWKRLQKTS